MQEMQEMQVQSLGQEEPLEDAMAAHCSILVWRIPWMKEPGGLHRSSVISFIGRKESDMPEYTGTYKYS